MTTTTALARGDRQFSCDSKGVVTSGRVTTTLERGRVVDARRPDRSWGRQLERTA